MIAAAAAVASCAFGVATLVFEADEQSHPHSSFPFLESEAVVAQGDVTSIDLLAAVALALPLLMSAAAAAVNLLEEPPVGVAQLHLHPAFADPFPQIVDHS